jgi:hypothetical protein
MAELKLLKKFWPRRRFIHSEVLRSLNDWIDVYEELKNEILTTSAFQLVGHKRMLEIDSRTGQGYVLIEVVGIPKEGFSSKDVESREVLVFDYPISMFEVDFLTLNEEARAIMGRIQKPLSETYHIVFDGNHLALHFFI